MLGLIAWLIDFFSFFFFYFNTQDFLFVLYKIIDNNCALKATLWTKDNKRSCIPE